MKIAFDGKRFFNNSSGLGVYSRSLFEALKSHLPDHEYKLLVHENYVKKSPYVTPNLSDHIVTSSSVVPSVWRSYKMGMLADDLNCEVFHGLSNELPQGGLKKSLKVVTIHDLIAYKNPQWFGKLDAKILKAKVEFAIKKADRIIVPSNYVLQDINRFFNWAIPKTTVIYEAVQELEPELEPSTIADLGFSNPYFLFVGNYNVRKNFTLLLNALDRKNDLRVVALMGNSRCSPKQRKLVERFETNGQLIVLSYKSASELKNLYRQAQALIYPSLEEGFGLPILEAMQNACPIITTKDSSMTEIASDAALYIDPFRVDDLLNAIKEISKSDVRNAKNQFALLQLKNFTTQKMAKETFHVYAS